MSVVLDTTSVVVKPEVAARQFDEDKAPAGGQPLQPDGTESSTSSVDRIDAPDASAPNTPTAPRRFYGRVSVEPLRMLRDLGDIADAVVSQLGRADASVTITVEIEATAAEGFPEDVRRAVDENARTLKFDTHEFEQ